MAAAEGSRSMGVKIVRPLSLPALPAAAAPTTLGATALPKAIPALNTALPINAAVPTAAQAQRPIDRTMAALQAPSLIEAAATAGADASRGAAADDFAQRIGLPNVAVSAAEPEAPAVTRQSALAPASRSESASAPAVPATSAPKGAERRSAYFPIAAAVAGAAAAAVTFTVAALLPSFSASSHSTLAPVLSLVHGAASGLGWTALTAAAVMGAAAIADAAVFVYSVMKGKHVTDAQFDAFVRGEAAAGRLDASIVPLVRPYRPIHRFRDLTFGFAAGGFVYVRPELVAMPWLFRLVLIHEHAHLKSLKTQRGPPAKTGWGRLWRRVKAELAARRAEFKGPKAAADVRVPVLERALRQAQMSLQLDQPYDLLVINPSSAELNDPAVYRGLSGDRAKVESVTTAAPQDVLGKAAKRYRAVVLDQPAASLPEAGSRDAQRLETTLKQLDSLFVLATRKMSVPESGFRTGSAEEKQYQDLVDRARKLPRPAAGRANAQLDAQIRKMWRQVASTRLKGIGVTSLVDNLYSGLQNKGLAFLSFGPGDRGQEAWERLLRYWEAEDGGQFRVARVDLENGGHIVVLRKVEARVGLWLSPQGGSTIKKSVPDAAGTDENRAAARAALIEGGFESELAKFDELGVEVSQVFGADVARQEIYITIPRRNAAAVRKFMTGNGLHHVQPGREDFKPELMDAGTIHRVPQAWKLGVTGADETILWIDTGGDATHEDFEGRLDRVDMVHEGPEDWIGHGTHVAGISISGNGIFAGMARGAKGIMAKVFGRDTPGAADGPIMGAGTIALQKGVSVISASLGVKGNSGSNLASFFSQLTHQPNSKGEYTLVVASAGNSGPFDRSLSQPAAGADVLSVAAAAKSQDDKIPEIAFFSSSGPDLDPRFAVKRYRFAPKLTAIGGDVVTEPGDPNVYKYGVYSAKSKDMPAAHSDTADKRHTGMSGTSMAAPMAAGMALLVRSAIRKFGAEKALSPEDVPLAVRAILMRTAVDMQVPLWYQGAGLIDALDAVKLVIEAVGQSMRARFAMIPGLRWAAPSPGREAFDWVLRYKSVLELEDQIYAATELAKSEAQSRFEDTAVSADDSEIPPEGRSAMGNAAAAEAQRRFNSERAKALPALRAALKDEVWLVRMQAAMTLLNLKTPEAAMDLADAALNDADGRVRQLAFLALAETPTHSVDVLLQKASADARWDVGVYAAYALVKRGDRGGLTRIIAETKNPDKKARYTAVWLLGQIGPRAAASEAEALAAVVADKAERGNIRHLAAAALTNLADTAPNALSAKVVTDLLGSAGTDNLALTRTISKFFPEAASDKGFVERLKQDPLRGQVAAWVLQNRSAAALPGALGEMVQQLAKLLGISLDEPTSAPDPSGAGVTGVDPALGPLDLLLDLPNGRAPGAYWDDTMAGDASSILAKAGLDAAALDRLQVKVKAALPLSGALWLSVPEHKLYALRIELERRGVQAKMPQARYSAARRAADAAGAGVTLDLSDGKAPVLPEGADLSLVRVRAGTGASEARLAAALEALMARAKPLETPTVVALDAVGPSTRQRRSSPLAALATLLALNNVGVVAPAGNEGPRLGSAARLGPLAVVVAAAAEQTGLQVYSGRGRAGEAPIAWAESVDELSKADGAQGTGEAAERSATKLAALARTLAESYKAAGEKLPQGWFLLLRSLVERTLETVPASGAHEVGGGLFRTSDGAAELLSRKLQDRAALAREAQALMQNARESAALKDVLGDAGAAAFAAAAHTAFRGPVVDAAARWTQAALQDAPAPKDERASWWKDKDARRTAVSVPLYALRRDQDDPGIGKLTDLGRYYKDTLSKQGADVVLLLPHFSTLDESPYAPVSLYAISEDAVDWSAVEEVRRDPALLDSLKGPSQAVDYAAVRAREAAVAKAAYERFAREELAKDTARARAFQAFAKDNSHWLDGYARFMAEKGRFAGYQDAQAVHAYSQWLAALQLKQALDAIHAAGGKAMFDVPMFRSKNSVDAAERPELFTDLSTRNPGIENEWTHEDWGDLALWNWTRLKKEGYKPILDPYRHWLDFGFDGARADALHFAYKFGNGQKASGDEPGDDYVKALAAVFQERGALPLAEAFEGKDEPARRFGFVTVGGDWKPFSTHDDPRKPGFFPRMLDLWRQAPAGDNAAFAAYTLGDEWADPFPVKEMRDGRSQWRYRIPLPGDADYVRRARRDVRAQLRALDAARDGDVWRASSDVMTLLDKAGDGFVRHANGGVQIWAASMDWFLEEWGRDTFVSLPGLLLSTGRFEEAKTNMRGFAKYERKGLIPNRIADAANPEYNTADGSMWFIQAVKSYVEASGDAAFAQEMLPVIRRIVSHYAQGTGYERYGRFNAIKMDQDGLVSSPAQSTWMDADPDGRDQPVTPRNGKAVEINALWYANLRFLASLEKQHGKPFDAQALDALADKVKDSFNKRFWFTTPENKKAFGGDGGALRDVVDGDPHGEAIRPNMLFAVSHGGDLLSPERRASVVRAATTDLLTPYGMRTLSPRDSFYKPRYETWKPAVEKDQAYHQGTVWPWLIGPYLDALARVRADEGWSEDRIAAEAREVLRPLVTHLASRPEASLPEVFDGGDPSQGPRPAQNPGGTRSQAWSVAEVRRILSRSLPK